MAGLFYFRGNKIFDVGCEVTGEREKGKGEREGVPLMQRKYIWGLCTGGAEKLIQVETIEIGPPVPSQLKNGALYKFFAHHLHLPLITLFTSVHYLIFNNFHHKFTYLFTTC